MSSSSMLNLSSTTSRGILLSLIDLAEKLHERKHLLSVTFGENFTKVLYLLFFHSSRPSLLRCDPLAYDILAPFNLPEVAVDLARKYPRKPINANSSLFKIIFKEISYPPNFKMPIKLLPKSIQPLLSNPALQDTLPPFYHGRQLVYLDANSSPVHVLSASASTSNNSNSATNNSTSGVNTAAAAASSSLPTSSSTSGYSTTLDGVEVSMYEFFFFALANHALQEDSLHPSTSQALLLLNTPPEKRLEPFLEPDSAKNRLIALLKSYFTLFFPHDLTHTSAQAAAATAAATATPVGAVASDASILSNTDHASWIDQVREKYKEIFLLIISDVWMGQNLYSPQNNEQQKHPQSFNSRNGGRMNQYNNLSRGNSNHNNTTGSSISNFTFATSVQISCVRYLITYFLAEPTLHVKLVGLDQHSYSQAILNKRNACSLFHYALPDYLYKFVHSFFSQWPSSKAWDQRLSQLIFLWLDFLRPYRFAPAQNNNTTNNTSARDGSVDEHKHAIQYLSGDLSNQWRWYICANFPMYTTLLISFLRVILMSDLLPIQRVPTLQLVLKFLHELTDRYDLPEEETSDEKPTLSLVDVMKQTEANVVQQALSYTHPYLPQHQSNWSLQRLFETDLAISGYERLTGRSIQEYVPIFPSSIANQDSRYQLLPSQQLAIDLIRAIGGGRTAHLNVSEDDEFNLLGLPDIPQSKLATFTGKRLEASHEPSIVARIEVRLREIFGLEQMDIEPQDNSILFSKVEDINRANNEFSSEDIDGTDPYQRLTAAGKEKVRRGLALSRLSSAPVPFIGTEWDRPACSYENPYLLVLTRWISENLNDFFNLPKKSNGFKFNLRPLANTHFLAFLFVCFVAYFLLFKLFKCL